MSTTIFPFRFCFKPPGLAASLVFRVQHVLYQNPVCPLLRRHFCRVLGANEPFCSVPILSLHAFFLPLRLYFFSSSASARAYSIVVLGYFFAWFNAFRTRSRSPYLSISCTAYTFRAEWVPMFCGSRKAAAARFTSLHTACRVRCFLGSQRPGKTQYFPAFRLRSSNSGPGRFTRFRFPVFCSTIQN